jgi:hypothetical protein
MCHPFNMRRLSSNCHRPLCRLPFVSSCRHHPLIVIAFLIHHHHCRSLSVIVLSLVILQRRRANRCVLSSCRPVICGVVVIIILLVNIATSANRSLCRGPSGRPVILIIMQRRRTDRCVVWASCHIRYRATSANRSLCRLGVLSYLLSCNVGEPNVVSWSVWSSCHPRYHHRLRCRRHRPSCHSSSSVIVLSCYYFWVPVESVPEFM